MLAGSVMLMGCTVTVGGVGAHSVIGSGKQATEQRPVSDINSVVLANSGTLFVEYGANESLSVTADDNILPLLTSNVAGGRLTLGTQPNTSITSYNPIIYHLTVKDLNALEISGSGDASLAGVNADNMNFRISGSGSLTATGTTKDQDVSISGSGSYNGDNLDTQQAAVAVLGSGSAVVKVSDSLKVNVSGSGSVTYIGNPKLVDKHVTGSGSVNQR